MKQVSLAEPCGFEPSELRTANAAKLEARGLRFLQCGLYREAGACFDKLTRIAPQDHRGYAGLARTAEAQWRWTAAVEEWNRCLALAPDQYRVRVTAAKADCYVQIGEIAQAADLLASLADDFEGKAGLARLANLEGRHDVAAEYWENCTIWHPDRVDGFVGKAANLLGYESFAEADALLSHVVSVWPDSTDAALLWARCAANQREWDAASLRWKFLLSQHKSDPKVCAAYGRYLATSNDRSEAEAFLAVLNDDRLRRAQFLLEYHLAHDDHELAIAEARKLVELESQRPNHRLRLAVLLMWHASSDTSEESLSILRGLHRCSPEAALIKMQLVEAYIRLGRSQEARELLLTIPAQDRRVEVELLRAWQAHHDNNHSDAVHYWKTIFVDFGLLQASKTFFAAG